MRILFQNYFKFISSKMTELNEAFVETVLKNYERDDSIKVTKIDVKPACDEGENFMSVIKRVFVTGQKMTNDCMKDFNMRIIVKKPCETYLSPQYAAMFQNEVLYYNEILPALQKHYKYPLDVPDCLYADSNWIVMKDLLVDGYLMTQGVKLPLTFCQFILKRLANLHAASIILKENEPELLESLTEQIVEILEEENTALKNLIYDRLTTTLILFNTEELVKPSFIQATDAITALRAVTFDRLCDLMKHKDATAVLTHGDCWRNNIMMKQTGEKQFELKFVDFQNVRYISPAAELVYFFYVNLQPRYRNSHMYSMCDIYLEALHKYTAEHGISKEKMAVYTKEWLRKEIDKFSLYGFLYQLFIVPVFYFDKEILPESDSIQKKPKKIFLKNIKPLLSHRISNAVFDYIKKYGP